MTLKTSAIFNYIGNAFIYHFLSSFLKAEQYDNTLKTFQYLKIILTDTQKIILSRQVINY